MMFFGADLECATGNVSEENMVGKGGFGRVLRHSDVAIKVLNTVSIGMVFNWHCNVYLPKHRCIHIVVTLFLYSARSPVHHEGKLRVSTLHRSDNSHSVCSGSDSCVYSYIFVQVSAP